MRPSLFNFYLFFLLFVFNVNDNTNSSAGKYIRLEYEGEMNKPIPNVVFYIAASFDTTTLKFGYPFQISNSEFDLVARSIEESKPILNSKVKGVFYEYTIVRTKEKFVFRTIDKNSTQIVFNNIIGTFKTDNKRKSIRDALDYIIKRF